MRVRAFSAALGLTLAAFPALASELRVLDAETGAPLAGGLVISAGLTNRTDASGKAMATGPKILVHKSGYVPMALSADGDLEIKLTPSLRSGSFPPLNSAARRASK